jgi:hypothetical protein
MTAWRVERLVAGRDLDEVLAIEKLCFTNPWSRQMFRRAGAATWSAFVARTAGARWRVTVRLADHRRAASTASRCSPVPKRWRRTALVEHASAARTRRGAARNA